jgi:aryl carrier-like protein
MNISIDGGRGLDKIHFIFLIKALKKEGVEVIYLNIIKVIYDKL